MRGRISGATSRQRGFGALSVLALFLGACGTDPTEELASAEARFAAGDWRTASIHLSNALQNEPDNAAARLLRGRILLGSGDPAAARQEFERARVAGAAPELVAALLAEALISLDDSEQALAAIDAVPESARDSDLWRLRAEALIAARRFDEAESALDRSAAIGGESSRLLGARARLAFGRGNLPAGEAFLTQAVTVAATREDRIEALAARGDRHFRSRRLGEAAADLGAAAELSLQGVIQPREVAVLLALVQTELARADVVAARGWARRLAERTPQSPVANYATALIAYNGGEFDEAVTELQLALQRAPDNTAVLTLLAAALVARGEHFQAEQQLLKVLAAAPNDVAAARLLAEARLRQQRPEAALEALRMVAGSAADTQFAALQGQISIQSGDVEQGIAHLEQAAAGNPGNQALQLDLARAYIIGGRPADAAALLDRVSMEDAPFAERAAMITSRLQTGNSERARADAMEMLEEFPLDPRAHMTAGVVDLLVGERAGAIAHLRDALRLDANLVQARLILAGLLEEQGGRDEAESELRAVLAIDAANAPALAGLAQIAIARGDFDEAQSLLTRAVEIAPTVPLRVALARLHLRAGELDAARAEVDAAVAAAPEEPAVLATRGALALASGQAAEAVRYLQSARDRAPARLDIVLELARAQVAAGDAAGSRETLSAASRAAPTSLMIRAALGATELSMGDIAAAQATAAALKADFPDSEAGHLLDGRVLLAQGRYAQAVEVFATSFSRAAEWEALSQWFVALQLDGQSARAEAVLKDWIADHPSDVLARQQFANFLLGGGREAEALAEYRRLLEVAPNDVLSLNNAAWLLRESAPADAVALARRASEQAPDNGAVLDTLGWLLVEQGRADEGLGYLERAARAAPAVADIQYHYAVALARVGRRAQAREIVSGLIAGDGSFESRPLAEELLRSLE